MNNTHGDILHSQNTTTNGPTINESIYRTKIEGITGGLPKSESYNNYQPRGEVGWICPVCGRGLAPSTSYCPCHSINNITFVSGGCTPNSLLNGTIDCNTTPT